MLQLIIGVIVLCIAWFLMKKLFRLSITLLGIFLSMLGVLVGGPSLLVGWLMERLTALLNLRWVAASACTLAAIYFSVQWGINHTHPQLEAYRFDTLKYFLPALLACWMLVEPHKMRSLRESGVSHTFIEAKSSQYYLCFFTALALAGCSAASASLASYAGLAQGLAWYVVLFYWIAACLVQGYAIHELQEMQRLSQKLERQRIDQPERDPVEWLTALQKESLLSASDVENMFRQLTAVEVSPQGMGTELTDPEKDRQSLAHPGVNTKEMATPSVQPIAESVRQKIEKATQRFIAERLTCNDACTFSDHEKKLETSILEHQGNYLPVVLEMPTRLDIDEYRHRMVAILFFYCQEIAIPLRRALEEDSINYALCQGKNAVAIYSKKTTFKEYSKNRGKFDDAIIEQGSYGCGFDDVIINTAIVFNYKEGIGFGPGGILFLGGETKVNRFIWDDIERLSYDDGYIRVNGVCSPFIANNDSRLLVQQICAAFKKIRNSVENQLAKHLHIAEYDGMKLRELYGNLNDLIAVIRQ